MNRRSLHTLLILLMLASGIVTAVQSSLHLASHQFATDLHHGHGWHDHDDETAHHALVIEGDSDEHGHHFHVHVPVCAALDDSSSLVLAHANTAIAEHTALQLHSPTYTPPVPPPNA